ncbi:hypothetical protein G6F24_015076 [Rhizopus arrhizus]|nr:hypothetical protein G6F24_015076 [Rhizopus arrhizus]
MPRFYASAPGMAGRRQACSARRRGQLARIQAPVAVGSLRVEALHDHLPLLRAGDRPALATGQLIGAQHAIAIAVHAIEGVQHPLHVLGLTDLAVAIAVHPPQVTGGIGDLRQRSTRQQGSQQKPEPCPHAPTRL